MIKQFEIPDIRDGLTSLQRRILWTLKSMGAAGKISYKRSAIVVRETEKGEKELEKFFDFVYYDTMVPMAQNWCYPYPLIDGNGNWGTLIGQYGIAASRFTECKLSEFSKKVLLAGLNQRTVKYVLNPNTSKKEPTILPARIPNVLVTGTLGSSHIPPHNLGEVIDGCIAMIKNPDLKPEQILDYIKGPDFPTGGTIINKSELPEMYQTGVGEIRIRGTMEAETTRDGEKRINIREVPYTMIGMVEEFIEYILSGDMKDFYLTDITGIGKIPIGDLEVPVKLKRDADIERNMDLLYEYSELESNFDYRALLTSHGKPCLMSLHQIMSEWLDFCRETMTKQNKGVPPTNEDMIAGLLEVKEQFATPRKTKIIDAM